MKNAHPTPKGKAGAAGKRLNATPAETDAQGKPRVLHVLLRHDADCPRLLPVPGECTCDPDAEIVSGDVFETVTAQSRTQRRAAAREAEKAIRRARKGGAR